MSVDDFIKSYEKWARAQGAGAVFRGLSCKSYDVATSALVTARKSGNADVFNPVMQARKLLNQSGIVGERDLDSLSFFQHYGRKTCLLDFTFDHLIALWFSCIDNFDNDGAVVCVSRERFTPLSEADESLSIETLLGRKSLFSWEPPKFYRGDKQRSVFLLGQDAIDIKDDCKFIISAKLKQAILELLCEKHNLHYVSTYADVLGAWRLKDLPEKISPAGIRFGTDSRHVEISRFCQALWKKSKAAQYFIKLGRRINSFAAITSQDKLMGSDIYRSLGAYAYNSKAYKAAASFYRKSINLEPSGAPMRYIWLSKALECEDNFKDSLAVLVEMERAHGSNILAMLMMLNIYHLTEDYDKAIKLCNVIRKKFPQFFLIFFALAHLKSIKLLQDLSNQDRRKAKNSLRRVHCHCKEFIENYDNNIGIYNGFNIPPAYKEIYHVFLECRKLCLGVTNSLPNNASELEKIPVSLGRFLLPMGKNYQRMVKIQTKS